MILEFLLRFNGKFIHNNNKINRGKKALLHFPRTGELEAQVPTVYDIKNNASKQTIERYF